MTHRMLFRHLTRPHFDSNEEVLLLPPLPRSPNGHLPEADAPYVRYSPEPSTPSSRSRVSEGSSVSSDHDSIVASPQVIPILTVNLPHHRAVCIICQQDFQTYQVGQIEPLEPLRKLHCTHVFHEDCIAQVIIQSIQQDEDDTSEDAPLNEEAPGDEDSSILTERLLNVDTQQDEDSRTDEEIIDEPFVDEEAQREEDDGINEEINNEEGPRDILERNRSDTTDEESSDEESTDEEIRRIDEESIDEKSIDEEIQQLDEESADEESFDQESFEEESSEEDFTDQSFMDSFECPTCRRSIQLRRDYFARSSGLGHPSLNLFSEPSPRPLLRRPLAQKNRMQRVDSTTSANTPYIIPAAEVISQSSSGSRTRMPPIQNTLGHSATKSPFGNDPQSEFPPRPREPHLGSPSAPVPGTLSLSNLSNTAAIQHDGIHPCLLWNPSKPTPSAPRRPCIPEEYAPQVTPDVLDKIAVHLSPDGGAPVPTLECRICNQPLVPAEPREGEPTTNRSSETGKSGLRKTRCDHIFHTDCLDLLIPSCECQLLTGDIECPTCAHPIPLKSLSFDSVGAMIPSPVTLPANIPSTWFRELLMDHRLLASSRHTTYSKGLHGISRSQRFMLKLQGVFSGKPHFEKALQDMQEKGVISFNAGTIRGPEGLWGHYISVSSIQASTLSEDLAAKAIWGIQWTEEEAKDVAALKVLQQLQGLLE